MNPSTKPKPKPTLKPIAKAVLRCDVCGIRVLDSEQPLCADCADDRCRGYQPDEREGHVDHE